MRKILIAALLVAIALPALVQTAMACSREQQEALQSQRDGVEMSLQRNDTSASPPSLRAQLREPDHYIETCTDSTLQNGHRPDPPARRSTFGGGLLRYAICTIASTGVRNASSISTATPSPVIASWFAGS